MRCSKNAYSTTVSRFLKGLPKYYKTKRLAGLRLNDYVCRSKTIRIATSTRKTIHLTMVTSFGVERNEGWQNIQSEVVMDDLFRQE